MRKETVFWRHKDWRNSSNDLKLDGVGNSTKEGRGLKQIAGNSRKLNILKFILIAPTGLQKISTFPLISFGEWDRHPDIYLVKTGVQKFWEMFYAEKKIHMHYYCKFPQHTVNDNISRMTDTALPKISILFRYSWCS